MKPSECRLESRKGNWITIDSDGKARPSTKNELYLWLQLVELRKESAKVFDLKGEEAR